MLDDLKTFVMIFVEFFVNADKRTYAAIGVGLIVAVLYFGLFFKGTSGFKDDVNKAGQIPIVHRDFDRVESKWSHYKLLFWIILSVSSGVLAYHQLPDWFPGLIWRK